MKKGLITIFVMLFMLCGGIYAQSSGKQITYQLLVLDNATGGIRANANVAIRVEMRQGSAEGNVVYAQDFNKTTDKTGTCTIMLDIPANLDWSAGDYYFATLIDGKAAGSSKITSVPYALHAQKAEMLAGTITKDELIGTWKCEETEERESISYDENGVKTVTKETVTDTDIVIFNADGTGNTSSIYARSDGYSNEELSKFKWTWVSSGLILLTEREVKRGSNHDWENKNPCSHTLIKIDANTLFIPELPHGENGGYIYTKQ